MTTELLAIRGGDFSGGARRDGTTIVVFLKGSGDAAAVEAVTKLFVGVHEDATRADTVKVIVDLRELEFMNSTCLKSFVSWVSKIRQLDSARQYRLLFRANSAIHWQRRSLNALRCFAVDVIEIEGLAAIV